ncbi:unnamed protein product [Rhizoctonia solani]|uniref:Uncharacterized protein n=1 Tax=Rhizoctonia solani TaxID=456999 RepID=A0A8H3ALY6_9AGAM|nr:unnamed protein product [Rhizoctonia solani]
MASRHRWAYFFSSRELIDLYKACDGKVGTFDPDNFDDVLHARRAIFQYLMPGRVRVWYVSLDGDDGIVFFIGEPVLDIYKAVKRDLGRRCWELFEEAPDPCILIPNSLGLKWHLSQDGVLHRLHLLEFLQSDRKGDLYPLAPEEIARLRVEYGVSGPSSSRAP